MDLDRLYKIANGDIEPETNEEAAFYAGYLAGVSGMLLKTICIEIKPDQLTRKELNHFIFGYGLGQSNLEEVVVRKENETLH